MIIAKCDKCGKEIEGFAALAFKPPKVNKKPTLTKGMSTRKYHMCQECWKKFVKWLGGSKWSGGDEHGTH